MKNTPKEVVVLPYDPEWPRIFEIIKSFLYKNLAAFSIQIEHVGSTSVPGLAAKAIIDIDIIVSDKETSDKVINKLCKIGYTHLGDLGIIDREALRWISKNDGDMPDALFHAHNLYCCIEGSVGLQNHLILKNYLQKHPISKMEYGELKLKLAQKFRYDIDSYIEGKTAFITRILKEEGFDLEAIQQTIKQNRAPGQ